MTTPLQDVILLEHEEIITRGKGEDEFYGQETIEGGSSMGNGNKGSIWVI